LGFEPSPHQVLVPGPGLELDWVPLIHFLAWLLLPLLLLLLLQCGHSKILDALALCAGSTNLQSRKILHVSTGHR
jgi:hypothetical protein